MVQRYAAALNPKRWTLNPKQNALNPWRAVKPAYAYACLSIAVKKKSALCLFVQCVNPKHPKPPKPYKPYNPYKPFEP